MFDRNVSQTLFSDILIVHIYEQYFAMGRTISLSAASETFSGFVFFFDASEWSHANELKQSAALSACLTVPKWQQINFRGYRISAPLVWSLLHLCSPIQVAVNFEQKVAVASYSFSFLD